MRAAWLAQETLTTFSEDIGEVALQPGNGGILEIRLGDEPLIFSRKESGDYPDAKEIKQLIRDQIDPKRDLGHSDREQQQK